MHVLSWGMACLELKWVFLCFCTSHGTASFSCSSDCLFLVFRSVSWSNNSLKFDYGMLSLWHADFPCEFSFVFASYLLLSHLYVSHVMNMYYVLCMQQDLALLLQCVVEVIKKVGQIKLECRDHSGPCFLLPSTISLCEIEFIFLWPHYFH